jgi:L-rhamnose mutarotase
VIVHLTARLRTDVLESYDRAHDEIPPAVVAGLREAGATRWLIWRTGTELNQLIVCDDWDRTKDLMDRTVPAEWNAAMARLTDVEIPVIVRKVDYSWTMAGAQESNLHRGIDAPII